MKTISFFFTLSSILILLKQPCYSQKQGWENLTGINTIVEIINDHPYLWLATDGGLIKFNKNTGEIIKYTKASSGLPGNRLSAIARYNKTVWIGTRSEGIGIGKLNEKGIEIFNPDNSGFDLSSQHTALDVESTGQLWVGEIDHITSFDGSTFTRYDCPIDPFSSQISIREITTYDQTVYVNGIWELNDMKEIKSHNTNQNLKFFSGTSGMISDDDGTLYYSQGNGLIVSSNGIWTEYSTTNSNIPTNHLGRGSIDKNGHVWYTSDIGLVRFDGSSFLLYNYSENYCPSLTMCIDDDNTIWLGGMSDVLLKFSQNRWEKININNDSDYSVINHGMAYDTKGNLWISTRKRVENAVWKNFLLKYDGVTYVNYTKSELLNSGAQLIFEDTSRYILTIDGLLFDHIDSIWHIFDLKNNRIASRFVKDHDGIIWEASTMGLKKYQNGSYTLYTNENSSLPTNLLYKIAINNEKKFIISNYASYPINAFIFECDLLTSSILYTSKAENHIIGAYIVTKKDQIWFGVRNRSEQADGEGLFKIENGNMTNYNISNSELPSNAVDNIYQDSSGLIWISANSGGIVRININNWTVFHLFNSALSSLNILNIASYNSTIAVLSVSDGITTFPANSEPYDLVNIEEQKKSINKSLKPYPNPFSTSFYFKLNAKNTQTLGIILYNIKGQQVYSNKNLNNNESSVIEINAKTMPVGIYIGRIVFNDMFYHFKIVKTN